MHKENFSNPRIVIVGMACRFPGASNLSTFWNNLISGTCSILECPSGDQNGRFGDLYQDTSTIEEACRFGGFLTDIDQFDAEFFRISPTEAALLDPQQRLMLEVSWRALENANIDPERLRETSAAVFAGISNNEYRNVILENADLSEPAANLYTITGTSLNTAIGRVSYVLGFHGPAMSIDTACSSSLVAIHQAVTALRSHKTNLALAGGTHLVLAGRPTELRAKAGMLSPDGTCKTFDAAADGYVRGEGCGIVVLKKLEDAQRDGDPIWAEVITTNINQDGTSDGLTVPNGYAQQQLIETALEDAHLAPGEVSYLEAHGTGTPVGDPIELNAASTAYGVGRDADSPLLVGSVKTNIGHLESSAGVAGVIKTVLALKLGVIPKHLNFQNPNPAIAWESNPLKVVTENTCWPCERPSSRIAGVSAFGFSGTNAHVLLKGYDEASSSSTTLPEHVSGQLKMKIAVPAVEVQQSTRTEDTVRNQQLLLPLSAQSSGALRSLASAYSSWITENVVDAKLPTARARELLADFCWTACSGRSNFNRHRAAISLEDSETLLNQLQEIASNDSLPITIAPRKIAFAYTGQGSQWFGMGADLYENNLVFRSTIDRCEAVIQQERGTSLIDRIFGDPAKADELDEPQWVQPCIYALECALTDVWQSFGVRPNVVFGHSLGEIAAARTAGVFSLEDGCRFAALRGQLMGRLPDDGLMAAVFWNEQGTSAVVAEYASKYPNKEIAIAAYNGAHQVISGRDEVVESVLTQLTSQGVKVHRLRKSPAYHSPAVEPILDELENLLKDVDNSCPTIPLVSNVSGKLVSDKTSLDGKYWRKHARQSVAFRQGVESVASMEIDAILEIGPSFVLGPMAELALPSDIDCTPIILASLHSPERREQVEPSEDVGFFDCLAQAYSNGVHLTLASQFAGESRRKITIPGYVFQKQRFWVEKSCVTSTRGGHPFLGSTFNTPSGHRYYETTFSASYPTCIAEHRVFDEIVVPGAIFGSMGFACSNNSKDFSLVDFQMHSPMVLPCSNSDATRVVQLAIQPGAAERQHSIEVYSKESEEQNWVLHSSGSLVEGSSASSPPSPIDFSSHIKDLKQQSTTDFYKQKASAGINLGTPFRTIKKLWTGENEAIAELSIRDRDHINGLPVQPLFIDALFQVFSAARPASTDSVRPTYLPFGWDSLTLRANVPSTLLCYAKIEENPVDKEINTSDIPQTYCGNLWIYDRTESLVGYLHGMVAKQASKSLFSTSVSEPQDLLYEVDWQNVDHEVMTRKRHPLSSLASIEREIAPFFDYLRANGVTPEARSEFLKELNSLGYAWIIAMLQEVSKESPIETPIAPLGLISQFGFLPEHQALITRMLDMLVRAQVMSTSTGEQYTLAVPSWESVPDSLIDPEKIFQELNAKHPHGRYELTLLHKFGASMFELLTGEQNPLELLFESDSSAVTDFYKEAPVALASNGLLGDVISRAVQGITESRVLRIIEVGAGTGASTEIVLSQLEGLRVEYTFTDISAGFFAEAEKNLSSSGIPIEFRALNIERLPTEQGFTPHSFDIVIAANVLHATRDLHETLSNCRELLVPGGMLVALEALRGRVWQDLTFGFLDGWWRFDDKYRKDHALASPEIWRNALSEAGYQDVVVFGGEQISEETGPLGSGTILAQASQDVVLEPGTWIIESDATGTGTRLRDSLEALNQRVIFSSYRSKEESSPDSSETHHVDHIELFDVVQDIPKHTPLRGVIHLTALDGGDNNLSTDELANDIEHATASALSLAQVLIDSGVSPTNGVWLVTKGAQILNDERKGSLSGATLWGFGKVVSLESSLLHSRMLDLDPYMESFDDLLTELLWPSEENHIAFRSGVRFVARLIRSQDNPSRLGLPDADTWGFQLGKGGSFNDLNIVEKTKTTLQAHEVKVRVAAVGLNFSDVLVTLGEQREGVSLGLEFSGTIVEVANEVEDFSIGDRVFGLGFGVLAPEITTHSALVAHAPNHLRSDQLATIPIAYTTADLAFRWANLQAGDRVLIHTATGGVGLAAIELARAAKAEIFATASKPKHDYLKSIGVSHIFDSRRLDFGDEILEATDGQGVNVVLNSLTSEGFIETSLKCLQQNGRFVEIGRRDILSTEEMAETRPDVAYHILSLDDMKRDQPINVGDVFEPLVNRFSNNELQPIRHTKWPITEVGMALQYMSEARHIGKLIVTLPSLISGSVQQGRTYLITGGFGGIGIAVANWLVENGATNLVLNGRRAPEAEAVNHIQKIRSRGVNVTTQIADVSLPTEVEDMLATIADELPPLGGVVHSVGVLNDGAISNQTWQRFEEVLWPKILGAWQLHQCTKTLDLDMFVLFSSAAGVLGNAGQANHAAANAFLDQLAAHRRALGLCGQSIAWGAWSEIGEAAEQRERIASQLTSTGTDWIDPQVGIQTLDYLVRHDLTNTAAMAMDWSVAGDHLDSQPPFLTNLVGNDVDTEDGDGTAEEFNVYDLRSMTPDDRTEKLCALVQQELQSLLRLSIPPLPTVGFFDLGIDSLMAVQLRNRLLHVFDGELDVSRTAVFDYPTVDTFTTYLAGQILHEPATKRDTEKAAIETSSSTTTTNTEDKIAVVGLACRLPKAPDYITFWNNLLEGVDCISQRRDEHARWHGAVGDDSHNAHWLSAGGFLDGLDEFDAKFFGIRPIDANFMDPKIRLLLECCWEAIESAGIDPVSLSGSRVGVYIGLGMSEYRELIHDNECADSYIGTATGMVTGRISHFFGFTGPSIHYDLVCTSSVVAIHEGVKALAAREVDVALVGGANTVLSVGLTRTLRELGILANDGICRPFDEARSGYVRGEGVGILILKRFEDAALHGNPIWATVLGSAVNQNGVSAGLLVPNGPAQIAAMKDALNQAQITPEAVDYLEAQASGQRYADPIEAKAVSSVYGSKENRGQPLIIGSTKSLIGHLEWAAGIASVIKVLLAMNQHKLPAQFQLDEIARELDWDSTNLNINREIIEWPTNGKQPIGAVNAFGMSGANAHLILQGYQDSSDGKLVSKGVPFATGHSTLVKLDHTPREFNGEFSADSADLVPRSQWVLPLSGKTPNSLEMLAQRYSTWLQDTVPADTPPNDLINFLADISWTACVGRSHFDHRSAIVFSGLNSLLTSLQLISQDSSVFREENSTSNPSSVFFLPHYQEKWSQFSKACYQSEPTVAMLFSVANEWCKSKAQMNLLDEFIDKSDENDEYVVADRICSFVAQVALADYLLNLEVKQKLIMCDRWSMVAAACAARSISFEQGLSLMWELLNNNETNTFGAVLKEIQEQIQSPNLPIHEASSGQIATTSDELVTLLENLAELSNLSTVSVFSEQAISSLNLGTVINLGPWATLPKSEQLCVISTDPSEVSNAGSGLLQVAKILYELNFSINFRGLFVGETRRKVSTPTYAFDRRSYWFND